MFARHCGAASERNTHHHAWYGAHGANIVDETNGLPIHGKNAINPDLHVTLGRTVQAAPQNSSSGESSKNRAGIAIWVSSCVSTTQRGLRSATMSSTATQVLKMVQVSRKTAMQQMIVMWSNCTHGFAQKNEVFGKAPTSVGIGAGVLGIETVAELSPWRR